MRIYVTPRVATFRDLLTFEPLPAEGAWKEDSIDWRRAEMQGDVSISTTGPEAPAEKSKKSGG